MQVSSFRRAASCRLESSVDDRTFEFLLLVAERIGSTYARARKPARTSVGSCCRRA